MSDGWYALTAAIARPLGPAVAQIYASGVENVPPFGSAALMVGNHISHFDPPLYGYPLERPIDYLALDDFFKNPIIDRFFRANNSYPFNRIKMDRPAIRWALQRLKMGRFVGVFPEKGIRFAEDSILNEAPIPSGTAALAMAAGVPVVPATILGADQLYQWKNYLRRPRVFIRYSPPLTAGPEESSESFADRILQSIRKNKQWMIETYQIRPEEMPQDAPVRFVEDPNR